MIFHENRLLADDSHVISYLIFFLKLEKMSQLLSSAAVVISFLMFVNSKGAIPKLFRVTIIGSMSFSK